MEQMVLKDPARVYLPSDGEDVKRFLTFTDLAAQFEYQRVKKAARYWGTNDPEALAEKLEGLKAQTKRCLLMHDEAGLPYTYSGLSRELHQMFGWLPPTVDPGEETLPLPTRYALPTPFYYQAEAVDALRRIVHGAVELPTGSGKSWIIQELTRLDPCQTLIVAPLGKITEQLYDELSALFGPKYVGKYGDGSKCFSKMITVATAQALTRVVPGHEAYESLSKVKKFIFDESHMCPAATFETVCINLAANAKRRYFMSATQMRNDGSEMLLKGITGPVVYRKEFRELVEQGYLARPHFKIFKVPCTHGVGKQDAKIESRAQLYMNPAVSQLAGEIATKSVLLAKRQTLVIVEQFDQFVQLKNFLGVRCEFVHGGADKETKKFLPKEYWDCDAKKSVKDFNEGRLNLLVGTSAIATGVDTKAAACVIYLQGGTSEIKVKQAIGRGTRIKNVPGKTDLWVVDFRVVGSATMERHTDARIEIYKTMSDDVQEIG